MTVDYRASVLGFLKSFHNNPDFDVLGRYFTDDAVYWPLVPDTKSNRGRKAILDALRWQYKTYYDCRCEIHASAADGAIVFTERSDHVILYEGDRRVSSRVCAVFECADDGRITCWREYWDTGNVAKQMGLSVSEVLTATAN